MRRVGANVFNLQINVYLENVGPITSSGQPIATNAGELLAQCIREAGLHPDEASTLLIDLYSKPKVKAVSTAAAAPFIGAKRAQGLMLA